MKLEQVNNTDYNNITCKFCDEKCVLDNEGGDKYCWFECKKCRIQFIVYNKDNTIESIIFHIKLENNISYNINIFPTDSRTSIWRTYTDENKLSSYCVKSFNYILDVNPQNAKSKLQTILTFL